MTQNLKHCTACGEPLSIANTTWYRQKNYMHICNDCNKIKKREQASKFYKSNPDEARKKSLNFIKSLKINNPIKYTAQQMVQSARKRATALGLKFDLDTNYIFDISHKVCPILGKEIKYGGGERTMLSASIDRINPEEGYTKNNVQVVCMQANLMKSCATIDDLVAFSRWVNNNTFEKVKGVAK